MIEQVRIANLGVIESAELNLSAGLTALTGETGAGKTMAVTSLELLLGAKADNTKVRRGADQAFVEGVFSLPSDSPVLTRIEDAGGVYEMDDDGAVVIVSRTIPVSGRSRSFIGGRSVPTAVLGDISRELVTVHGQSEQLRLATSANQRRALDTFGGSAMTDLLAHWQSAWAKEKECREALAEFDARARDAARQRLAWEALVSKVDEVSPVIGEDDALKNEARRLEGTEALYRGLSEAAAWLSGSDNVEQSVLGGIGVARESLRPIEEDPEIAELVGRIESAEAELSDIAGTLSDIAAHSEADPERLFEIYERRQALSGLRKSLGMDIDEAVAAAEEARENLAALDDPETARTRLQGDLADAEKQSGIAAKALSRARKKAAKELQALIAAELPELALPDATLAIEVAESEQSTQWGRDTITFTLASHKNAPQAPLGQSASGGELSRVMLAVEVALASRNHESDHTFLFDEVDAGVGGRAALAVGKRLAMLAHTNQVIVVTHLAQVAAYAGQHAVVVKETNAETTRTDVVTVTDENRLAELARMLSGSDSATARAHAAELLSDAFVAP